jgi:hypothetical protein
MRLLAFILLLITSCSNIFSYPLWVKSYGNGQESINCWPGVRSVVQNANGNFLISGFNSTNRNYLWYGRLLCVNQNGDTVWTKKFDSKPSVWNASGLELFPDQSIYLISNWQDPKGTAECILYHFDSNGSVISSSDLYNPYPDNGQECWAISQNSIGGLDILTAGALGGTYSTIRRLDATGKLVWLTTVGSGSALHLNNDTTNYPSNIIEQPDNGVLVCGWRPGVDIDDSVDSAFSKSFVYKVNSSGKLQWFHTYGLKNVSGDALSGILCANGDNIFWGWQSDKVNPEKQKTYLFRINKEGQIVWERDYLLNSCGSSVFELADSTLLVLGNDIADNNSSKNIFMLHLSKTGDSLGCTLINYPTMGLDYAMAPKEGGFLLGCGSLTNGITLLRTDPSGSYTPIAINKKTSSQVIDKRNSLYVIGSTLFFSNYSSPQTEYFMEIFTMDGSLIKRSKSLNKNWGLSAEFSVDNITSGPKLVTIKNASGKVLGNKIFMFR